MVCKGRLGNAELGLRSKFPTLLPNNNRFLPKFLKLIISEIRRKKTTRIFSLQDNIRNMSCKLKILVVFLRLISNNRFTELLIMDCHRRVHHYRERATLAELRSKFWVTRGRQCVKRVIKSCLICKKLEGRAYGSPFTVVLPDLRVTESPPFSKVGVVFFWTPVCERAWW